MAPNRSPNRRRAALAGSVLALALLTSFTLGAAGPRTGGLVVHEWGTFTVVVGREGTPVRWRPLRVNDDLPSFVEVRERNGKSEIPGTVRMETPVIYFYSERETKASVTVDFPAGQITEWYPYADVPYSSTTIAWKDVRILPGAEERFPVAKAASHYYAARETDAAPLAVRDAEGNVQPEKMLFYRGVGTFGLPLSASLDAGSLTLTPAGAGLTRAVVVDSRGGEVGLAEVDLSSGPATIARPRPVEGGAGAARAALLARLEAAGLFPREAAAMLATWGDTWMEDGLRVFFVVPRETTDALLPLRVEPAPDAVERVLLGRIEIVRPETEEAVAEIARELAGSLDERAAALRKVEELGHFREPILRIVAARDGDGHVARALRRELHEIFREY